jgi:circadian clock protein KaiC
MGMRVSSVPRGESPRAATGIRGFDEMTGGGMPRGMTTLLVGGPGSGKTVFSLQTLAQGARDRRESGLFVSFEEDPQRIVRNAAGFEWTLAPLLQRRNGTPPRLAFLDARLSPDVVQAGDFDLAGLLARIGTQADAMRAGRIVLDGIDMLLTALDDPRRERQEIHRLHRWLADRGMTAILTAKSDEEELATRGRRYGFLDFMVDCVVELNHRCIERVSTLSLRVVKFRGARFVPNEAPFTITRRGISVSNVSEDELDYPASTRRVPTGVKRLDAMLGGGYFRGSVTLISGSPGTAKSTLAGTYVDNACRRGERALYVSFDEASSQLVRNLSSVGIQLGAHERSGRLRIFSPRADSRSAESHLLALADLIHDHQPRHLVLDPVSALLKSGSALDAVGAAQNVLRHAKAQGITTVCTSLVDTERNSDSLAMQVSTLADTWIQVSYVMRGGERNRALTIVKSRGTKHSDQVRELVLGDRGVTLADAYVVGGDVLMGTARWQAEEDERAQRAQERSNAAQRRAVLLSDVRDLSARGDALQREIAVRRTELAALVRDDVSRESQWTMQTRELRRRRGERGARAARIRRGGAR